MPALLDVGWIVAAGSRPPAVFNVLGHSSRDNDRAPMTETLPANSAASLLYSAPVSINPATANLVRKSTRRAYRGVLGRLDA